MMLETQALGCFSFFGAVGVRGSFCRDSGLEVLGNQGSFFVMVIRGV